MPALECNCRVLRKFEKIWDKIKFLIVQDLNVPPILFRDSAWERFYYRWLLSPCDSWRTSSPRGTILLLNDNWCYTYLLKKVTGYWHIFRSKAAFTKREQLDNCKSESHQLLVTKPESQRSTGVRRNMYLVARRERIISSGMWLRDVIKIR